MLFQQTLLPKSMYSQCTYSQNFRTSSTPKALELYLTLSCTRELCCLLGSYPFSLFVMFLLPFLSFFLHLLICHWSLLCFSFILVALLVLTLLRSLLCFCYPFFLSALVDLSSLSCFSSVLVAFLTVSPSNVETV